jgi:phenylacetate-CoA ligase
LLRYRTGDFARLDPEGDRAVLRDLEGRPPVCLLDDQGRVVNTIDVSRALAPFSLARFQLHQTRDGALSLAVSGAMQHGPLRAALDPLFGPRARLSIKPIPEGSDAGRKLLQYTSETPSPSHYVELFGGRA